MKTAFTYNRKALYIFLTLAVILSGICFGAQKSEYKWQQGRMSVPATLQLRESTYGGNEICTGDLLGLKNINVQEKEAVNTQSDLRINIYAIVMLFIILFVFAVFVRKEYLCVEKWVSSRRIIIRYIHHQDGEKGVLL